jgi:hypothetical protein
MSQVVAQGSNTVLDVTVSGTEPLVYRWYFGTNLVAGANGPELIIPNTQLTNAGNYHVTVTNVAGADTSVTATITVGVPPSITSQPANQFVSVGSNVTLQVSGSGSTPMTFQWLKDGVNISGAVNSMLVLNNIQTNQSGLYKAVLANNFGSKTSAVATVSVAGPPRLLSVSRATNGVAQVILEGISGHVYELLSSSNLNGSNWTTVGRLTNASGNPLFIDNSATNKPLRFYRGRLVF